MVILAKDNIKQNKESKSNESNKKACVLIILDGFGTRISTEGNGPKLAKMPFYNSLIEKYPHTFIEASGHSVGLPDGQMGTSEVGHLNIGSGRIIKQELIEISDEIKSGEFFKNKPLISAMEHANKYNSSLHIMGLVSDGGVHSSIEHLYAIIDLAKKKNVQKVFIHAFLDGRDTPPASAARYVRHVKKHILNINSKYEISTVCGRYYAMDRDKRWDRIQKAYDTLTGKKIETIYLSAEKSVNDSYKNKTTDEFVLPCAIDLNNESQFIGKDDAVIFFNFRSDRARELTRAFVDDKFTGFERKKIQNLKFVCMCDYDSDIKNVDIAYPKENIKNTLAEYLSTENKKQFHTAETEKYAHVTFFFNGGIETPFKGEDRLLIPSPKVATYDLVPQMSAGDVTKGVLKAIESKNYDFIVVNFANPDMIGHTGKIEAIKKALEFIDGCLEKIMSSMEKNKCNGILTSDHGNCEQMIYANGSAHTCHTTNKVPFFVIDSRDIDLKQSGALCDIAPTILDLMNLPKPKEMTGESMIVNDKK